MDKALYNAEKFTTDDIRAVDAKFEAQKIAFAPLTFQAIRAMIDLNILRAIESAGDKGITRAALAEKTGVNHKIIKEYNGLASNEIKPSQKLVIPSEQNVNYLAQYIVKSGDTLGEVSQKFDVALEDLKEANTLMSSNGSIGAKLAATE